MRVKFDAAMYNAKRRGEENARQDANVPGFAVATSTRTNCVLIFAASTHRENFVKFQADASDLTLISHNSV